jgi:hypothetical protein
MCYLFGQRAKPDEKRGPISPRTVRPTDSKLQLLAIMKT